MAPLSAEISSSKLGHQRINYSLLAGILVVYPFSLKICNALIITLLLHWIIWISRESKHFKWRSSMLYLMIGAYLLCVFSLLYTSNKDAGIFVLDKKFPLLALPLVIGTIPKLKKESFQKLFMIAIASIALAESLCLISAVIRYFTKQPGGFFWTDLLTPLDDFHPSYLSLYLNFLTLYIGTHLSDQWTTISNKKRIIAFSLIVFFFIFIILLSSKIQIINFGIIVLFFLYKFKPLIKTKNLIVIFTSLIIAVFLFLRFSYTGERFLHIATLKYELDAPPETFNEFTIRLALAECSWEVIKKHPIIGVGAGDVFDELEKVYYKYDYKFGYLDQQNPHNEYLSHALATGLPGVTILLLILSLSLRKAMKRNDPSYVGLIMLFISYFIFESMLERHKGIVLFAFFTSLYFFHGGHIKSSESRITT